MKLNKQFTLFLLFITLTTFGKTDTLYFGLTFPDYLSYGEKLLINNDDWTEYTIDIEACDRDSVANIGFGLSHQGYDSLFVYIDLITLIGTNGTKIVEDFEDYIVGGGDMALPDRYWNAIFATNGTIGTIGIIQDNGSKCLKYGGCNKYGVDFFFYPNLNFGEMDSIGGTYIDYQNWTGYQTISMQIKRVDYTTKTINHEQNRKNNTFYIYQNQLNKTVYITLPELNKTSDILVYSVSGKLIKQFNNISSNTFAWKPEGLSKGIYIVKVVNGMNIYSNLLVIK